MYNAEDFFKSWETSEGNVNTNDEIMSWISSLNVNTKVEIKESYITPHTFWYYDKNEGVIKNRKNSFFQIGGIMEFYAEDQIISQPIIFQKEIGFLGIICKKIKGIVNFLMQAKIEPGNINCIQISPTIQATKSNFTRAHGGRSPKYLEYFVNSGKHQLIYDQLQSEQASRFYKKRNRNMILALEENEEIIEEGNFKWMTLGQIKWLMGFDNLVNMDTRTVLSGLSFEADSENDSFVEHGAGVRYSYKNQKEEYIKAFNRLNDFKMFADYKTEFVPLQELQNWEMTSNGIFCKQEADFDVRFYDISIEGREVQEWMQPLVRACGEACFGLLECISEGKRKFLVKIRHEIGSFDEAEFGPSIQFESTHKMNNNDDVETFFCNNLKYGKRLDVDVMLSEEGGRFYHEQNRNVIMRVEPDDLPEISSEYIWMDYGTLNWLGQTSHCLNIQLRNLLSLIKLSE